MLTLNPVPYIASTTRWLQARYPQHSLRGLWRLQTMLKKYSYHGVIRLSDHLRLEIDSSGGGAQRWIFYAGIHQVALTYLLHQHVLPGSYCIDVGSHIGFYTVKFAHWGGAAGRVAAFEANPEMADWTRRNVVLNHFSNIEVINKAVHSEPGTLQLYLAPHTALGMSSVVAGALDNAVKTIDIEATSLDSYLDQQGWPRLDVIKIDTEGNDLNVIMGAKAALTRFKPLVVFELRIGFDASLEQQVFDLFKSLGYTLQILDPHEKLIPFDDQVLRSMKGHVDIICFPARS